jgi:hypothetical protein
MRINLDQAARIEPRRILSLGKSQAFGVQCRAYFAAPMM